MSVLITSFEQFYILLEEFWYLGTSILVEVFKTFVVMG